MTEMVCIWLVCWGICHSYMYCYQTIPFIKINAVSLHLISIHNPCECDLCVCEQNTLHCSWLTQAQTETVSKALVITSWLEKLLWSCSTPILIVFLLYFYYPTVYLWLWQMATNHWAQFCLRSSPVQRQSFLTTVASCLLMGDSRVSVNELKSAV